jgi:hypothetical protein
MSNSPIQFTVTPTGYLSCSGDDPEVIDTLTAHARRQAQEHRRSELRQNLITIVALLALSALTLSCVVAVAQTLRPYEANQASTLGYSARPGN